ncbi:TPA: hypothetical protein RQK36_004491 [Vibrio vulnificus]|nr:hypothetical protein [Vibrio vulnificus]
MKPQFEEKTYESYFNSELDKKASIYFPFGQCQEGYLGVDSSAYVDLVFFSRVLGFPLNPALLNGRNMLDIADDMERILKVSIRNMPNIKVNLLLQYKRSDYITSSKGKEWNYWKESYYRYDIYRTQQKLLDELSKSIANQALILYVAPAIFKIDDLIDKKINEKIIENSNFALASKLSTHHRNTYTKSGCYSIACSEPERIEKFNLLSTLERMEVVNGDNSELIKQFAEEIKNVIAKNEFYGSAFLTALSQYEQLREFELLYAHIVIAVLKEITGLNWLVATA